ncbi:MAG: DUF3343 domain-containing protein [Lachnospiraceae bacterium]|nr:DUF3343 domain-containing protein [Lachnospiraceae bacterium]
MIRKQERVVITFKTTTMAMAMETACKKQQAPGRLIPVPKSISAGCGLAWSAAPEDKELLCRLMEEQGITPQEIHVCMV